MYQEIKQTKIFTYPKNEDPKARFGNSDRILNMVNRLVVDHQRNWLIMYNSSLKRLDILDLTTYKPCLSLKKRH